MSTVLVIAPHVDDETLGCGATIARHAARGDDVVVAVVEGHGGVVNTMGPPGLWAIKDAECRAACRRLGVAEVRFLNLPTSVVAALDHYDLNAATGAVVADVEPDVVYAPFVWDQHGDHGRAFRSFAVHWRPYQRSGRSIRAVYAYETVSETHQTAPLEPAFSPNAWVVVSPDELDTKLAAYACYESQVQAHPSARSIEAVEALAVWRGSQVGAHAAEAFVTVREVLR